MALLHRRSPLQAAPLQPHRFADRFARRVTAAASIRLPGRPPLRAAPSMFQPRRIGRITRGLVVPLFNPDGAVFESDNYLKIATQLDGTSGATSAVSPDGPTGSLSFWIGRQGTAAANTKEIIRSSNGRVRVNVQADDTMLVTVGNGTSTYQFKSTSTVGITSSGWTHVAIAYDTAHAAHSKIGIIVINGVAEPYSEVADTAASFNVDHTEPAWALAASTAGSGGGNALTGRLMEFIYAPNRFVDWTVAGNLATVFRNGRPVDPGTDGSIPFGGNKPAIYFSIRAPYVAADFLTNKGSGVNFALASIPGTVPPLVALRWRKALLVYGHSIEQGSLANPANLGYAYLTARAFGRCIVNRAKAGALVDDQPGAAGATGITLQMQTFLSGDVAEHPESAIMVGGGYNSKDVTLSNTLGWFMTQKAMVVATGLPYLKVGTPKGGSNGNPDLVSDSELEWGTNAEAVKINNLNFGDGGANPHGDQDIWGSNNWFDCNADLVANGLQRAFDLGFSVTVPAGTNDAHDIAAGVVPRSLRDTTLDTNFHKYGIHNQNSGHAAQAGTSSGSAPGGVIVKAAALGF